MTKPPLPPGTTSPIVATPNSDFSNSDPVPPLLQDAAATEPTTRTSSSPQSHRQSLNLAEDASLHKPNEKVAMAPIPGSSGVHRSSPSHHSQAHGEQHHAQRKSSASTATSWHSSRLPRHGTNVSQVDYQVPDMYANLDELAATPPIQNPDEAPLYRYRSLEDARKDERVLGIERRASLLGTQGAAETAVEKEEAEVLSGDDTGRASKFATQLYTHCYLILFSILGTLARLGLQTLTEYPGAPVIFGMLWANFGGSLVMGFLTEDRMLFLNEWGTPTYDQEIMRAREQESGSDENSLIVDLATAKKTHLAIKKTIPLYIGLATGFCGSFTSFSSFVRDIFLAMTNDLVSPDLISPTQRSGGYSFMAMLSVIILTVCLSLSALFIGAHLAIAAEPMALSLPYPFMRKFLDRLAVPLSVGAWAAAIILAIVPPHAHWRGDVLFALVFAPLGCLVRFYLAIFLNGRVASFPLGTFAANMAGTVVLGMCFDFAHVPLGGVLGCQILQGMQDGFCGCLTTVSTWVAELAALRRWHAYVYGTASVSGGLALLIAIMGGLRWSSGFDNALC